MTMQIVGKEQFTTEVINYEGLSIVDFWAERCGPCRMVGPVLEELEKDNAGKAVKIVKIDVDANPGLAGEFGIQSIPTIYFVKGGQIVDKMMGAAPKMSFQAKIDEHLTK